MLAFLNDLIHGWRWLVASLTVPIVIFLTVYLWLSSTN